MFKCYYVCASDFLIKTCQKFVLSLFCGLMLSVGYASIHPGALIEEWDDDSSEFTKVIKNTGDKTEYVNILLYKIEDPFGVNKETPMGLKEMVSDLLVSPLKMILPPKYEKILRLSYPKGRQNFTKDHYYKIVVQPVLPSLENGFFNVENKMQAGVQLNIAYGTLLIVTPLAKNIHYQTEHKVANHELAFNNKGNSFVKVEVRGKCQESADNPCKNDVVLDKKNVYAGQNITISLKKYQRDTVTYTIYEGKKQQKFTLE
ncbi:hypothetical protein [Cysteiniphilum marinum]|uniref:hypothetical protein n=1 Tax=Cysteiniphilum marinum TaxID=2774191 RepID=UPI00193A83CB|nr:hypothetical protein [Cysteiniphilum marinum]